ncbi:Next to BRCA1 gene 1 protein [Balamuthia mandrillaris]
MSSSVQHIGITCDNCGQCPIRGNRFKCGNCDDFDLCEACEANHNHRGDHLFIKIRRPLPSNPPRGALLPDLYQPPRPAPRFDDTFLCD